ncbi:MAG: ATP-binding cassette domain-containing protein [Gammaproteobacteria bacterium]
MKRLRMTGLRSDGLGPIDLELDAGECLCLSGPSGAGKTRLLRALADLDPHAGSVELDGMPAARIHPAAWRRQVGLLPADCRWWAETVGEHFAHDARSLLPQVGLTEASLDWRIERLSSGERQRLGLLRLLANSPKVLLLDEPTANLDARNIERVETLIAAYRREHEAAVIWVSHDPEQIARVADRHLRIENGRLRAETGAAA